MSITDKCCLTVSPSCCPEAGFPQDEGYTYLCTADYNGTTVEGDEATIVNTGTGQTQKVSKSRCSSCINTKFQGKVTPSKHLCVRRREDRCDTGRELHDGRRGAGSRVHPGEPGDRGRRGPVRHLALLQSSYGFVRRVGHDQRFSSLTTFVRTVQLPTNFVSCAQPRWQPNRQYELDKPGEVLFFSETKETLSFLRSSQTKSTPSVSALTLLRGGLTFPNNSRTWLKLVCFCSRHMQKQVSSVL